jgi:predicted DNA-binding WGR domain protein
MTQRWCLLKDSDGARGAIGKKKIYEVILDGSTVRATWGMAEKSQRQNQSLSFATDQSARVAAVAKVNSKIAKGYRLAFAV